MANVIDDATIDYVGILAKLELSDEEKEQDGPNRDYMKEQNYRNKELN